jgi:DNA repair protein RadD
VQILGEGFDHPRLSVAAIFRPFRSLSPYIQFVGRAMRVNLQGTPGHPDNQGIIVSHVGLNIDQHWDDFKPIDREDQELVHNWLGADDATPEPSNGEGRRRFRPDMVVTDEFIDRLLSDTFIDASDDALVSRKEHRRRHEQPRCFVGFPEERP